MTRSANLFARRSTLGALFSPTFAAAVLMAALALSGRALASASQCAVYSGGTVVWAGTTTNVNEFEVNYGQALINNTATGIQGNFFVTKGAGKNAILTTDTGGAQAAGVAYYVYYAQYVNGGVTSYTTVVSKVVPFTEGYPSREALHKSSDPRGKREQGLLREVPNGRPRDVRIDRLDAEGEGHEARAVSC